MKCVFIAGITGRIGSNLARGFYPMTRFMVWYGKR